jgi:hypothetical protein
MRTRLMVPAVVLLMLMLGTSRVDSSPDGGYPYPPDGWLYSSPEFMNRIGQVLNAIDNPTRRSEVAESWVQFTKTAIAKNLEFRQQWLDLQKQQLAQNEQADQQRLELAQLQLQIEQLRAENLKLERENMQMKMGLGKQTAPAEPNHPAQ